MFADTLTVTVNSVAKVLNRIRDDGYSSEYYLRDTASEFSLNIRNSRFLDKARGGITVDRHNVEFIEKVYPVAPSTTTVIRKAYTVFEHDVSDSVTAVVKHTAGFLAFHTEANLTKLANRES